MSKSNCTKVHPGRDPGPCSVPKCGIGKFDPSDASSGSPALNFKNEV
jgi:hypothetical protein